MGRCQGLPANQAPRPTCRIEAQKEHAEEPGEREKKRIITGKMTGSGKVTDQTTDGGTRRHVSTEHSVLPTRIPTRGRRHYPLNRGCPEVLFLGTVELGVGIGSWEINSVS